MTTKKHLQVSIGKIQLRLESHSSVLLETVSGWYENCHSEYPEDIPMFDLDADGDSDQFNLPARITQKALSLHNNCVWLSASTLVSPSGKSVLIAGPSHSGKTTLSLSLVLGYGWKLVAEDICLIDLQLKEVVSINAPMLIRAETCEKLRVTLLDRQLLAPVAQVISFPTPPGDFWYYSKEAFSNASIEWPVNTAIALSALESKNAGEIEAGPITASHFIETLLSISNLLRVSDAMELLIDTLSSSSCYNITGGYLAMRVDFINSLF